MNFMVFPVIDSSSLECIFLGSKQHSRWQYIKPLTYFARIYLKQWMSEFLYNADSWNYL